MGSRLVLGDVGLNSPLKKRSIKRRENYMSENYVNVLVEKMTKTLIDGAIVKAIGDYSRSLKTMVDRLMHEAEASI